MWLRLTIGLVIAIVIMRVISYVAIANVLEHQIRQEYSRELEVHLDELSALVRVSPDGRPVLTGAFSDRRYSRPGSGFYWQLAVRGGMAARSASLAGGTLPLSAGPAGKAYDITGPTGPAMLIWRDVPVTGGAVVRIVLATDDAQIERTVDQLNTIRAKVNALASLLALPLCILAVWYAAAPLRAVNREIGRIGRGEATRIEGAYPSDVQPLADKINRVIENYETLAAHCRIQASTVVHNVRGVMVVMLDEIDQITEHGTNGKHKAALMEHSRAILRSLERHTHHADRPAGLINVVPEVVDLEPVLEVVFEAAQQLHRQRRLDWELGVGPSCRVSCSRRDFGDIMFNLLDNAGKWATSRVRCGWSVDEDSAVVEVADDGPGFAPLDASRAAEPERGDPRKGLGMGLSLVSELAAMHGGQVSMHASPLGGACLHLRLPLAKT